MTKFICNLNDKKSYAAHIKNLKQTLNQGLKLEKAYRMIRFNKKSWLKPHIDINTNLRKKMQIMILKKISLN